MSSLLRAYILVLSISVFMHLLKDPEQGSVMAESFFILAVSLNVFSQKICCLIAIYLSSLGLVFFGIAN